MGYKWIYHEYNMGYIDGTQWQISYDTRAHTHISIYIYINKYIYI